MTAKKRKKLVAKRRKRQKENRKFWRDKPPGMMVNRYWSGGSTGEWERIEGAGWTVG